MNARWVYALLSPAVSNDIPARLAGNVGECSLPSIQKMAGQVAGLGTGDGVTAGLGTLAAAIGNAAHSVRVCMHAALHGSAARPRLLTTLPAQVYAVQLSADGGANHYFVLQQDGPTCALSPCHASGVGWSIRLPNARRGLCLCCRALAVCGCSWCFSYGNGHHSVIMALSLYACCDSRTRC